jgi:oxygen-independent coproporphyrinogen-3 oxidase
MSPEDRMRRDIILELMCNGRVDKRRVEAEHGVDFDATFALELEELETPASDGLVELSSDLIKLTPIGQVLMRNVAVPFDRYLRERKARGESGKSTFSKTL